MTGETKRGIGFVAVFSCTILSLAFHREILSFWREPPIAHDESGHNWYRLAPGQGDMRQRQIEACIALDGRAVVPDLPSERFCCVLRSHRDCDMPAQN